MPLAAGQSLSFYEILAPLGAGGMGEVWRARDTRLEREVAIKVLPEHFADDEERLKRFEREAKTLASLSHPNIGAIHGVDQVGDLCFLALELVEGEDLADRLAAGPLRVGEALDVCRQIADGLAAAHDAGVVHRDLKPANVRITQEGVVKVLDFGLAKPTRSPRRGPDSTPPKPDSFLVTEEGLVLGTPTYMSPEQARGRPVDRETDVWSFGCVLFECLTGERAFEGDAVADLLAAIVEHEPDYSRLPAATPPQVTELLRRTLEKDPRQRLQHLGDARLELERALRGPAAPPETPRQAGGRARALAWLGAGLALGAVAAWFARAPLEGAPAAEPGPPSLVRLSLPIPRTSPGMFPRVLPDGSGVVYQTAEPDPAGGDRSILFLRRFDDVVPKRLAATEHARSIAFSPDGSQMAVVVGNGGDYDMVRIDLGDGGAPRVQPLGSFAPEPNLSSSLAWTERGELVTTVASRRLAVRAVDGGEWRELELGLPAGNTYVPDVFRALPGGRHVLAHGFAYGPSGFVPRLLAIDTGTGETTDLGEGGHGLYRDGLLYLARADTLYAVPFDPEALAATGPERILLTGLRTEEAWRPAWFDLAPNGTLVTLPGGRLGVRREVVTIDRGGEIAPWGDRARALDYGMRVAPDGSFLVVGVVADNGVIELWGSEVDSSLLRPLLKGESIDYLTGPIDAGRGEVYVSRMAGDAEDGIWRFPLGDPEALEPVWVPDDTWRSPTALDLSPDGRRLLIRAVGLEGPMVLQLDPNAGDEAEPRVLFPYREETYIARTSPDGEWLVYTEAFDGRQSILLREAREDGGWGPVLPVPLPDEFDPWWAMWGPTNAEGEREILFLADEPQRVLAVPFVSSAPPRFGTPELRALPEGRMFIGLHCLPDGTLLAILAPEEEAYLDRIEVAFGLDGLLAD